MITDVMLDSGAYGVWTGRVKISLDDYCEFLKSADRKLFGPCIALDVVGDEKGSFENFKRMQKRGLKVIPVFHAGSPLSYLDWYMEQSEYIGLGGIAKMVSGPARLRWLDQVFSKHICGPDGMPKVKVHGFGMTSFALMRRYPWFSLDSTSTVMQAANARCFIPERAVDGAWQFHKPPLSVTLPLYTEEHIQSWASYPENIKNAIRDYCKLCKTKVGDPADPKTGGILHDWKERMVVNIITTLKFVDTLPEWPWAFKVQRQGLITA